MQTRLSTRLGRLKRKAKEHPSIGFIQLGISLLDFGRWVVGQIFKDEYTTFLGPITLIGIPLMALWLWLYWDTVGRKKRLAALCAVCMVFGFQLGWTRIVGLADKTQCVKYYDLLPDNVKALRGINPRTLRGEDIQLFNKLAPCDQVYEDYWMSEPSAISEVRRKVLEAACVNISDTRAIQLMNENARDGSLKVKFWGVENVDIKPHPLPIDSIDIVMNGANYKGGAYGRQYWSGDICAIPWED